MEITEIKSKLTLAEVIKHYGYKADKQNRINCPFHADKTPSMQLYYKTHTAYCFSSNCKTHGKSLDVIDFVMHKEGYNKHEAIKKCVSLLNGEAAKNSLPSASNFLLSMFTYFKNGLQSSNPGKEYLALRGLDYKKIEVGYNAAQFHHGARKEESLIKQCLQYGLLLDKGLVSRTGEKAYNVFGKCCIVFALRNAANEITGLYFRSALNDKEQRHFYLKNRKGLYPNYPKAATKKLILTESIIDAATLLQYEKITNEYSVLALYGTNGLTAEHTAAVSQLKDLDEIIFFLNGDNAGRASVNKYAPALQNEIPHITITNVEPPEGEDVNSLLIGHNAEVLIHLLQSRKPFSGASSPEFIFSIENTSVEKKEVQFSKTTIPTTESAVLQTPKLEVINPLNILYKGVAALCSVKGGQWLKQPVELLKVSLQIINTQTKEDYRTKADLYDYKHTEAVSQLVAERLGINKESLIKDLQMLAHLLEEYREQQQENNSINKYQYSVKVGESTQAKCIDFLSKGELLQRINELIGKAGVVGEENNRIFLFLIASSYKMKNTLHALIQGSSGSGKTRLLKVISELMPMEDVKKYTRVTDSSFYNQEEYFFVNKLVCFEDYDGLKEDAQLAVRELQSNEILISSTSVKDENGKISGGEKIVRGPIASMACTTKGEVYEDNISRCFVLAVDESMSQTKRIIEYQNNVAAGIVDKSREKDIREFLGNCIRLIKPYEVVNPYANRISLPQEAHKIRRLNELYQCLVKQITLLNQYRRKQDDKGRLVSEKEDLQQACEIMFESILLKVDELDGSLRQFYEKLKTYIKEKGRDYEFNRFEVRAAKGVSKTQQHFYINRLVSLEYVNQSGFANRGFKYKIAYWDNQQAVRAKIKDNLFNQLQAL